MKTNRLGDDVDEVGGVSTVPFALGKARLYRTMLQHTKLVH